MKLFFDLIAFIGELLSLLLVIPSMIVSTIASLGCMLMALLMMVLVFGVVAIPCIIMFVAFT